MLKVLHFESIPGYKGEGTATIKSNSRQTDLYLFRLGRTPLKITHGFRSWGPDRAIQYILQTDLAKEMCSQYLSLDLLMALFFLCNGIINLGKISGFYDPTQRTCEVS